MMTAPLAISDTSSAAQRTVLVRLWLGAALVAAVAAAVIWDRMPGINWMMSLMTASAALLVAARAKGTVRHVAPPLLLALTLSIGILSAASPFLHFFSIVTLLVLVAMAVARSHPERYARAGVLQLVTLPVGVFVTCLLELTRRGSETVRTLANERAVPIVRGVVLTLPIAGLFALLLSSVDPTMTTWREQLEALLSSWHFVPRMIFFTVILGLSLGALGYAIAPTDTTAPRVTDRKPLLQLGETERLMVMSAIAGVFTLFLTLQLSYLFGNAVRAQGSDISYAEWARRGFAELTVVATLCGGVTLALALMAPARARRRLILAIELIVLGETQVLLHSAFRRVLLYEDAYGFTTMRLYAQAYMLVMAASIVLLAYELIREPNARRLLGRAGALGVMALALVSTWNHESWIVRRNVARYEVSGKLDVYYLACELSSRAVPEVLEAANRVADARTALVGQAIGMRFANDLDDPWYAWNAGRARARSAIGASMIVTVPAKDAENPCGRLAALQRENQAATGATAGAD